MIDVKKIDRELSKLMQQLNEKSIKPGQVTRLKGKINFLRFVIQYLETGPTDEFLKKEHDRIGTRIQLINDQYNVWIPTQYFEKEKDKLKHYFKECGVPKLKLQLKALRFIINQ